MWFAPTPAKITIPLMCIVQGGRMVGLMWNPMQKWYGEEISSECRVRLAELDREQE